MRYLGSKNRLAKDIVPIIQSYITESTVAYIEPFTGGGNVIDKISCKVRKGYDIEPYIIAVLQALENGWEPPRVVTEDEYKDIKTHKEKYPDYLVGYVGYQLSYGGKFFGGYRRDKVGKRDYCREAYNYTYKQIPLLSGIEFGVKDYLDLDEMGGCVIYCDPPYRGTTRYTTGSFDYDRFYEWCADMAKRNTVLVSEYFMPDNITECIWSKPVKSCLDSNRSAGKDTIEKIFKVI